MTSPPADRIDRFPIESPYPIDERETLDLYPIGAKPIDPPNEIDYITHVAMELDR